MNRRVPVTFWRVVFAAIVLFGAYATFVRFFHGLGAATNLSDQFPWGLWIGFDVLVGVGLAAGGFTVAAAVHIFHIDEYKPIARPAVFTAFVGYLLVSVGLLFDIGQPWNIWHPLIMWNPRSVMFEVAWCVMLYSTVLALEFSPIVLERFGLKTPLRMVRSIYLPLVVLGVLLSMMHQSSLGTLFVIVPDKLHGLWYTPLLPVFFFLSAVAAGLAMTIIESYFSHRAFKHELKLSLLQGMARVIVVVLAVFLVWKIFDLAGRGNLGLVFTVSEESVMFWGEFGLGVIAPMVLMAFARFRRSRHLLFIAAMLTVLGFIVGRLNVAITGMQRASGVTYFPSVYELGITIALIAAGFAAFAFAVRHLGLFPKEQHDADATAASETAFEPIVKSWGIIALWALLGLGALLYVMAEKKSETSEAARVAIETASIVPVVFEGPDVNLPDTYTFPGSAKAGPVEFDHDSHFDEEDPNCRSCHWDQFKLLKSGTTLGGRITMDKIRAGKFCGSCHNGDEAFGIEEGECDSCHAEEDNSAQ